MDLLRVLVPHIAVMPRLIDDTGDLAFVIGIAEDETILPAVLHQPLLHSGALLGFIQMLIIDVHNIHCQSQLMLASTWDCHRFPCLHWGVSLRVSLCYQAVNLILEQLLLVLLCTVGGADDWGQTIRPASVHHGL